MCIDTFFNQTMMDSLVSVPPIVLVQAYYECHQTPFSALQSAVGSASGAASLYANTAMAIICGIIFFLINSAAKDEENKLLNAKDKARKEAREARRAEKALQQLMGTMAQEYIALKSKAASPENPSVVRMTDRLETYKKYFPFSDVERLAEPEEEADPADAASEEEAANKALIGKRVGLVGLNTASGFNGAIGKCIVYSPDEELFSVTIIAPLPLRGKKVKIRFENMYLPTKEEIAAAKATELPKAGVIQIPLVGGEIPCTQS